MNQTAVKAYRKSVTPFQGRQSGLETGVSEDEFLVQSHYPWLRTEV